MKIFVTGGAGYIGSIVCKLLQKEGHRVAVFDNLSTGNKWAVHENEFYHGDVRSYEDLSKAFSHFEPDAVMHFAARAYVGESLEVPLEYYDVNVSGSSVLLRVMADRGCKRIIFSSTCSIYGESAKQGSISEMVEPSPINPYARTKWIVELMLRDVYKTYGISSYALRYFNAAGAMMNNELGEWHVPETHLIPNLLKAAISGKKVNIYGNSFPTRDGTCERDYTHVEDLASAHTKALAHVVREEGCFFCNVGTGQGYTILEIVDLVENITGKKININMAEPRSGDPASLVADPSKAKKSLEWCAKYDMRDIIESAYRWEMSGSKGNNI